MRIAIYRNTQTQHWTKEAQGFFDKVVHEDHLAKLKGFKSDKDIEVYCFDGTDIDDIIQNLVTGFSSVAVFQVSSAKIFKQ